MRRLQFIKTIFNRSFLQPLLSCRVHAGGSPMMAALFLMTGACAHAETQRLIEGRTGQSATLERALSALKPGGVVIMGEQHGFSFHQDEQMQLLKNAQESGLFVSVGMEFFSYPDQALVTRWRQGALPEADFLKAVGWGGFSFDYYRPQVLVPRPGREMVVALNSPRALTGKVAKKGLDSLTPQEKAMLPPQFQVGNARYFERFKESIGHLPDPSAAQNYFVAQSIWDDTMAWQAAEFLRQHPEQTLFIIVGEFHVQYGGGLPDRLKARGIKNVTTISLVNVDGLTTQEEATVTLPNDIDGARADFVWVTRP